MIPPTWHPVVRPHEAERCPTCAPIVLSEAYRRGTEMAKAHDLARAA